MTTPKPETRKPFLSYDRLPETQKHERTYERSFDTSDISSRGQAIVFYQSGLYKGFARKAVQSLVAPHVGKGGKIFLPSDNACKTLIQILDDGFTTEQEKVCLDDYETNKTCKPISLDDIGQEAIVFGFEYAQNTANIFTLKALKERTFDDVTQEFVYALFHYLFSYIRGYVKECNHTKIDTQRAENDGFSIVDMIPFEVDRHFTFTESMKDFFSTLTPDERTYTLRRYHDFTQTESAQGLSKFRTSLQRSLEKKAQKYYRDETRKKSEPVNHKFLSECLTYGINTAYNRHYCKVSDRVENSNPVYSREACILRDHRKPVNHPTAYIFTGNLANAILTDKALTTQTVKAYKAMK